jgi:hypothetical protein
LFAKNQKYGILRHFYCGLSDSCELLYNIKKYTLTANQKNPDPTDQLTDSQIANLVLDGIL